MGQSTDASLIIMNKLLQFLLPFVVESALVRNNIHILRKKILGHNIYDRHVKPDGKVEVNLGIDFVDMDFCPHKHMLKTSVYEKMILRELIDFKLMLIRFGNQILRFTILLKHPK